MHWQGNEQLGERRRGNGSLRTECVYGLRRSQTNRMDCQDSARPEERKARCLSESLRKETITKGTHRVESCAQSAASWDRAIACRNSQKSEAWYQSGHGLLPVISWGGIREVSSRRRGSRRKAGRSIRRDVRRWGRPGL